VISKGASPDAGRRSFDWNSGFTPADGTRKTRILNTPTASDGGAIGACASVLEYCHRTLQ